MQVWFDPLTPKQALLFYHIGLRFKEIGWETLYTSRNYDYTTTLFESLTDEPLHVIGEYGGASLMGKMKASAQRMIKLTEFFERADNLPDIAVSFSSPDATRVAFGLGIPITLMNDTPHATAVGRLTIPLANRVIVPKSIPMHSLEALGSSATEVIQYDGVDEVEWLRNFEPNYEIFDTLGLDPNEQFILARPEESSAAYYLSYKMENDTILDQLVNRALPDYEGKFVILPRYPEQAERLRDRFNGRAIIPDKGMDSRSLMIHADLVITGGGTIGREAALLGVKSLCYFPKPLDVNDYLIEKGFPLHHATTLDEAVRKLEQLIKEPPPDQESIKAKMSRLETPGDVLLKYALPLAENQ